MVDTLVNGWLDPSIFLADLTDLCHFPRHEIADAEAVEQTFSVQSVDLTESIFERVFSVRTVEVEHINLVAFQGFETVHQTSADILWLVGVFITLRHWRASVGVELCVHHDTSFLPVEVGEDAFTRAIAVDACGVDFIMAVLLENVQDLPTILIIVYTGSKGI